MTTIFWKIILTHIFAFSSYLFSIPLITFTFHRVTPQVDGHLRLIERLRFALCMYMHMATCVYERTLLYLVEYSTCVDSTGVYAGFCPSPYWASGGNASVEWTINARASKFPKTITASTRQLKRYKLNANDLVSKADYNDQCIESSNNRNSWPRPVIIKGMDGSCRKVSPFVIYKRFKTPSQHLKSAKTIRSGNLLFECNASKQSSTLLKKCKSICHTPQQWSVVKDFQHRQMLRLKQLPVFSCLPTI